MRLKKYKCPSPQFGDQCTYPMFTNDPCDGCGKTYEETRTIWDEIRSFYRKSKNVLYSLKCRFFNRFTTIKPRNLSHEWCDRDYLLISMVFEIACQFIEKEGPKTIEEWDEQAKINPHFYKSWKRTTEICQWWLDKAQDNGYIWRLSDEEFDAEFPWGAPEDYNGDFRPLARLRAEEKLEKEIRERAKELIDCSPYYWT